MAEKKGKSWLDKAGEVFDAVKRGAESGRKSTADAKAKNQPAAPAAPAGSRESRPTIRQIEDDRRRPQLDPASHRGKSKAKARPAVAKAKKRLPKTTKV
jgi:hypothetical protein